MIFLMQIYFIFAVIVIYKLMKKYQGKHKWRRFLLLAFLFYLPVGWDVILGRAYFHYLCNKDGGIHIYDTVELGPEFWNKDGRPNFYDEKGRFDEDYFSGKYSQSSIFPDKSLKSFLPVRRDLTQVTDNSSETVLGEKVSYLYVNGWVVNTWQPFSTRGTRCFGYKDLEDNPLFQVKEKRTADYRKFTSYIFINKNNMEVE